MVVRGEDHATQLDRVAVLQLPIDLDRLEGGVRIGAPAKVGLAAAFEKRRVLLGHHHLRLRQLLQMRETGHVVEVAMRGRQDPDVLDLETELRHVGRDLADSLGQAGIDQDMTLRRRDQIRGQIVGADPVDVADHPERRKRLHPVGVANKRSCGLRLRHNHCRKHTRDEQHCGNRSLEHQV